MMKAILAAALLSAIPLHASGNAADAAAPMTVRGQVTIVAGQSPGEVTLLVDDEEKTHHTFRFSSEQPLPNLQAGTIEASVEFRMGELALITGDPARVVVFQVDGHESNASRPENGIVNYRGYSLVHEMTLPSVP